MGVIWIDAHADIHTPYTTPSGNIHGMPLATALGIDNLESRVNNPIPETVAFWEQLKNMGGLCPKVKPEDVVFISVRDTEKPEDEFISRNGIKNYTVAEVRTESVEGVVEAIKQKLSACDMVYVSFDVDSMDSILVSKGTGTPVENGLSPEEAGSFMNEFAKWDKVNCIELVEINPCLDDKINRMAEVASDILEEFTQLLENRLK
jgi:arginase